MIAYRNVLDGGKENQHGVAELPYAQRNQRAQCGFRVAEPAGIAGQTDEPEQLIDCAVVGKKLLPEQGDGDAAAHQRGNIERRAIESRQIGCAGKHQRDQQRHRQLNRHLNKGELECDLKGSPKQLILKEHRFEIIEPDPFCGGKHVVLCKCQIQRGEERNDGKHHKPDDKRQDEHIARHVVTIQHDAERTLRA